MCNLRRKEQEGESQLGGGGMRTFYIQLLLKGKWVAIFRVDDARVAKHIANNLAKEFSVKTMVISKTRLLRKQGIAGLQQAELSILKAKEKPAYKEIIEYAEQIKNSYEDSIAEEKDQEKTIDYLLRDIPKSLHRKIKEKASEQNLTLREFILKACEDAAR